MIALMLKKMSNLKMSALSQEVTVGQRHIIPAVRHRISDICVQIKAMSARCCSPEGHTEAQNPDPNQKRFLSDYCFLMTHSFKCDTMFLQRNVSNVHMSSL